MCMKISEYPPPPLGPAHEAMVLITYRLGHSLNINMLLINRARGLGLCTHLHLAPYLVVHVVEALMRQRSFEHWLLAEVRRELREHCGSVVECLTLDRGFEPHRCHCVVSLSKTHLS